MKAFAVKPFSMKPSRAKPIDREGLEQAALIKEISLRYPAAAKLIYHVPNGGHRHKLVASKLKEQGVKAGVPDLVLPMARGKRWPDTPARLAPGGMRPGPGIPRRHAAR